MALFFFLGAAYGPNPSTLKDATKSIASQFPQTNKVTNMGYPEVHHMDIVTPILEDLGDGTVRIDHHTHSTTMETSANGEQQQQPPIGQHLLVDIQNVEAAFLNSEQRLADAMVNTCKSAGLTMLSYHCHSLIPMGVSCVGVLIDSHISFHTWPDEGVITLDLFSSAPTPLMPAVNTIQELFGIPRRKKMENGEEGELEQVKMLWSHELRGFTEVNQNDIDSFYIDNKSDLARWVLSQLDYEMKNQLASVKSRHYRIDIWDYLDPLDRPSHEDAMKHNLTEGDERWNTCEATSPNRLLFLNGYLQYEQFYERPYFEALVHPVMFTHPNPQNVAILGGSAGGALREVLKHNTVESVTQIELDQTLIDLAREHLAFMNDCSNIVGSADSCFDDDRTNIEIVDPTSWFANQSGTKSNEKLDVVIMNLFNPNVKNEVTDSIYRNPQFVNDLMNSLGEDGMIALNFGDAPTIHDPRADKGIHANREIFLNLLEQHPMTSNIFVYEEGHAGFEIPQAYLVVCKSADCRERWYAEAPAIEYEIETRTIKTKNGISPLFHFDAATQFLFQVPPRPWETIYCRREPMPFECDYRFLDVTKESFDFDYENLEGSNFIIKTTVIDGEDVTGLYSNTDIPKGSYILPAEMAASYTISDSSHANLKRNLEITGAGEMTVIQNFIDYVDEFGHKSLAKGAGQTYVEIGVSHIIRRDSHEENANIGKWMPAHPSGKVPVYSPVYERRMGNFDVFLVATRDIMKGEEIVKYDKLWAI
jgi:spermidine synthase/S-adenosylmethionine/arginine decarboxylase-like enzyme